MTKQDLIEHSYPKTGHTDVPLSMLDQATRPVHISSELPVLQLRLRWRGYGSTPK